ncbi:MAG: DNA repair protein RecO [Desulfobacteraceae bacterium]|nr:DNA repair protein RecO [Desulfobacteraceae bacterium]
MAGFSTDGILLKRIEYGDYDLIVTFFTVSMGRISVIAKNAKKSVKRFAGALEPFSAMNLECTWPKRKNTLPILNSVELSNPFAKIRTDTAKTGYACYWLELVNSWMEEGKAQAGLYELLYYVLAALDSGTMDKEILSLLFQIRFMNLSGFTPDLTCCGTCATPLDEIRQQRITFDFAEGRLVCARCGKSGARRHAITVSKGTLKQLFWIINSDIQRTERLRFSPCTVREGEALLEAFIPCHIGREVKSLKFLRRIREVA